MSVRTGITVLGTAIGYYFGAPQLGYALGSLVGNAVDPQKIQGPSIGDGAVQTARAGVAINLVYGGPIPVVGTLIESGPITKIEVEEEQPKGGPVTVSERALKTFAILICQNGLGGPIAGISKVKMDGKVVYDAGSAPASDGDDGEGSPFHDWAISQVSSARFLRNVRFYLGTDDQMPDPAIEAIRGVGLAPAYRRRAYAVFDQFDITDYGVRVPQVEFEVVGSGTVETGCQEWLPLLYAGSSNPWRAGNLNLRDPRKSGVRYQYSYYDGTTRSWRATLDEAIADAQDSHVDPQYDRVVDDPQILGWCVDEPGEFLPGCSISRKLAPWDTGGQDANGFSQLFLCMSRYPYNTEIGTPISLDADGTGPDPGAVAWVRGVTIDGGSAEQWGSGVVVKYTPNGTPPDYGQPPGTDANYTFVVVGTTLGEYAYQGDFSILVRALPDCGAAAAPNEIIPMPEASDDVLFDRIDRSLVVAGFEGCDVVEGSFLQLSVENLEENDDFAPFETKPCGPVIEADDEVGTQEFWEAAYERAVTNGILPSGWTYPDDYPVATDAACCCSPPVFPILSDAVPLWMIQQNLCERVGLPTDRLDVSELTDIVKAFKVAKQMTAADASGSLQSAYAYARGEWDSKLRFPKLGGPIQFTITEDDLLAEDGLQELTRGDAYEVPQKIHAVSIDVDTLVPVPQTAERFSPDVLAQSQATISLPLVLSVDETMQAADRAMKVAMANKDGGFRLRTWVKFLSACATDVFAFQGKRFRIDRINLNFFDGVIEIEESRRDRQSAYTSTLTGVPPLPPTTRRPNVSGPTLFVAMNLPSLRTQDNVPGVYLAATGFLESWAGCAVIMSVDGGATFHQVATFSSAARVPMGFLTAPVDDNTGSPTQDLNVDIFGGDLASVTDEQLALGLNLAAIVDATTLVAEVVQHQDATETSEGRWLLEGVDRGLLETTPVPHFVDDYFVTLRKALFLPIDQSLAGTTLIFRAVTNGTAEEANPTFELVFEPPIFVLDGNDPP